MLCSCAVFFFYAYIRNRPRATKQEEKSLIVVLLLMSLLLLILRSLVLATVVDGVAWAYVCTGKVFITKSLRCSRPFLSRSILKSAGGAVVAVVVVVVTVSILSVSGF